MVDNSSLPVASGNETFANDDIGGVKYPRPKINWGPDGTANDVDVASGKPLPTQVRHSDGTIVTDATGIKISTSQLATLNTTAQAMSAGFQLVDTPTDGTNATRLGGLTETAPASDTASSGLNGRLQRVAQRITSMIALLPAALGQAAKTGSLSVVVASDQGLANRAFAVTFATLTRPANTTAYTAADSISDNATAGSVTALVSGNISDTNNDPIFINELVVNSTDTGLAGKKIRAYLFNSDPTARQGVGGGDNAAYSQKKAGYLGSFMGWMETGFSDGTVGRLVPCFNETNNTQAGGFIVAPPVSGARTLYIQYQAVEAFTPSANSTTIIGTARGWQGRAA
jgi:hypothetical protein